MLKRLLSLLNGRGESGVCTLADEHGAVRSNIQFASSERQILENLLTFRELRVGDVMIPRADLVGIEVHEGVTEVRERFVTTGYTRLPVYRENLDDIVGFVHIKDFISYLSSPEIPPGARDLADRLIQKSHEGRARNFLDFEHEMRATSVLDFLDLENCKDFFRYVDKLNLAGSSGVFKVHNIMRKVIYASRSTKCIDLLAHIRSGTTHMAIVLDEYGGTEGMVVLENLIEEIVGDIRDEHDQADKILIQSLGEGVYKIDGRAPVLDVEEATGLGLSQEDGEYETFGGFILSYLDRVPVRGEKIVHPSGFEIEIIDAELRKIKGAKLKILGKSKTKE